MAPRKFVRFQIQRNYGNRRNSCHYPTKQRYSRKTDCWNCGMADHKKDRCPLPSSLKCSFCQRQGVRSDQCRCPQSLEHSRRETNPVPNSIFKTRTDTAIFVKVYGKTVRALLNPSVQETTICLPVVELVQTNTGNTVRKLILRQHGSINLVRCIRMKISTRKNMVVEIDGIINEKLSEKIIILGMDAIQKFGFKFFVGGQEAKIRQRKCIPTIEIKPLVNIRNATEVNQPGPSSNTNSETSIQTPMRQRRPSEDNEEDRMSFLDEDEERMIREWN